MERDSQTVNWVERRFRREQALGAQGPEIWNRVRASIQDACESFNGRYAQIQGGVAVECSLENGHRLLAKRSFPATSSSKQHTLQVIVGYSSQKRAITATHLDGPQIFSIDADDEEVFVQYGGSHLNPDEVSQKILIRLLFPLE